MEVTVGDVWIVLQAGHGEEIVPVRRFPDIDQVHERFAVVPQEAGADLDAARGSMMRMTRDAERALASNLLEDVSRRLIGTDPLLDVQRDDVCVQKGLPGANPPVVGFADLLHLA